MVVSTLKQFDLNTLGRIRTCGLRFQRSRFFNQGWTISPSASVRMPGARGGVIVGAHPLVSTPSNFHLPVMTSTQVGLARYCPVKSIVQKQNQSVTEGFTEFTQCSPVSYLAGSLLKEGNRCSIHLSYEGSITKSI